MLLALQEMVPFCLEDTRFPCPSLPLGAVTGEENPASKPTLAQGVQGDRGWTSLHHRFGADSKDKEPEAVFTGESVSS